jgi:flagellar FliL protein
MLKGRRKLAILPVVLLLVGGVGYSMATKPPPPKMKIQGTVYAMPASFLLNLQGGRFAKLNVALLLAPGQSTGASASGGGEEAGTLPEEAVIRAIITNAITNDSPSALVEEAGRKATAKRILKAIQTQTDVKVQQVLFPDLTVQ